MKAVLCTLIIGSLTLNLFAQKKVKQTFWQMEKDSLKESTKVPQNNFIEIFNDKNVLTEKIFLQNNIAQGKTKYIYNDANKKIEEQDLNKKDSVMRSRKYTYDNEGNLATEKTEIIGKGKKLNIEIQNFYDKKNELIKKIHTVLSNDSLTSTNIHLYENKHKGNVKIVIEKMSVNGKVVLVDTSEFKNDLLVSKKRMAKNPRGDSNYFTEEYKYEINKKGDWTKKQVFRNGNFIYEYRKEEIE